MRADLEAAGARIIDETDVIDGNFLTADGSDIAAWVEEALDFFSSEEIAQVEAA